MATTLQYLSTTTTTLLLLLVLSFSSATALSSSRHVFSREISPEDIGLETKHEKLTHFRFYFHDIASGNHPSAIPIIRPLANSSTFFGVVIMMDDPLTLGPDPASKLVGRAQGVYASASQEEAALLMVFNFAFVEGKYNGSNLSLLGRNAVFSGVREMPVVGGSGVFRFARGYAQAKTYSYDLKTGDAVVEYNVYVFHY